MVPAQNSPPANNTRFQRNQTVLTTTARTLLEHTPSVNQLSSNLDRGLPMEGGAPYRSGGPRSRLGEESVEEEGQTEVVATLSGAPEASETPNLAFLIHLFSLELKQIFS
ncbi:hypothetical protein O181_074101 [Austropuccinia psidii MF-1]|uniref:Uncharacterized protein n=1 Tax=Austropuccinia psidii MF-1 TaxID=1389203 RepID=A0A9Q3I8X2_9BASI|nr:hypothetical protein [Austropuccinia psidii MF-1]